VTLVVPAGALSADTSITITPNVKAPIPAGASEVGAAYTFEPDGLTFEKAVAITFQVDPSKIQAPFALADVRVLTAPGTTGAYTPLPTSTADATHVTVQASHFCTDVPVVYTEAPDAGPDDGGDIDATVDDAGVTDAGLDASQCRVTCELGEVIDGGVACDCSVTCGGVLYDVQCVCGACTCYQDHVAVGTTTDPGICSGLGPTQSYKACGFPASPNMGGAGGPTDANTGGVCP
jgi:hypothetical protein